MTAEPEPYEQAVARSAARTGLNLNLRELLQGFPAEADLVRGAVTLRAAAAALKMAEQRIAARLSDHGHHHVATKRTKYRAPVPGIGQALLPQGDPHLEVDDHEALASWLRKHHGDAYDQCVTVMHVVLVLHPRQAYNALHRMEELARASDMERHDPQQAISLWEDAADDLAAATARQVERNVDLAELEALWSDYRTERDLFTPDGEPVPHLRYVEPEPQALRVTPDSKHLARLATQYARALGIPEELINP